LSEFRGPTFCAASTAQRAGPLLLRHKFCGKESGRKNPGLDLHPDRNVAENLAGARSQVGGSAPAVGQSYSDQNKYAEAIPEYEKAREFDPAWPTCANRLGQAYVRTAQKDRAQAEFRSIKKSGSSIWRISTNRGGNRQFVYSAKNWRYREAVVGRSLRYGNHDVRFHKRRSLDGGLEKEGPLLENSPCSSPATAASSCAHAAGLTLGGTLFLVPVGASGATVSKRKKVVVITFGGGARDQEL